MEVRLTNENGRVTCTGEGMHFLKLKAAVAAKIGSDSIKTESRDTFSFAESALSLVQDLVTGFDGTETNLADITERNNQHTSARLTALSLLQNNETSSLSQIWLDILDPAQSVAVSAMTTPGLAGLCLFDEQGIGKTVMTIATYDELRSRGEVEMMVIIAPVTMMQGWAEEIAKFLPQKYKVTVLDGDKTTKRSKLLSHFDVLVCNFESLTSILTPLKAIVRNKKTMLAVDESFNVKNKDAVRSESVRELRRYCSKGFVMCGTPAPNSAIDVIHQFDVADDGFTFAGFSAPKDPDVLLESISQRIDERGTYIRRLKSEVLPNLPDKNFHVINVAMTGRQAELYEDARQGLEIQLKSMDNAIFRKNLATYFQQRSALLQICSSPKAVDPGFSDISAKTDALDTLVEELVSKQGKKVVIWSFYKASLAEIVERYKQYSPVLLDGSVAAAERAQNVKKFQTDPAVRICVANPAAAGAGVTLHAASDAIYISFSNQAAHFLQSIDRIHRRGQTADSVHYHIIVCKDTIEENEIRRLREKEVRQHQLLNDQVKWPNSLDEALAELQK